MGIHDALTQAGFETFIVGGAVRDRLMGNVPKDIDYATAALPEDIENVVNTMKGYRYVNSPAGDRAKRALTSLVVTPTGETIEITTFRGELYDGSRTEIMATPAKTFKEDAMRRDFTINAMGESIDGEIIDYFGGMEDIDNQIIRAVGNPNERFIEDPLRMIRGIRFAVKCGFDIEPNTYKAIIANRNLVKTLSSRRLRDEIGQCLYYPNGYRLLMETGILPILMPELKGIKKYQHNLIYHPEGNLYNHYIECFNTWTKLENRTELGGWGLLFHDIAKPVTADWNGEVHTFHKHDTVGEKLILEKYNNEKGPFEFSKNELRTLAWTTKMHLGKFWRMKRVKKVADMGNNSGYPLLLEVIFGDSMGLCEGKRINRQKEIMEITETYNDKLNKLGGRPKGFAVQLFDKLNIPPNSPLRSKALVRVDELVASGKVENYEQALEILTKEAEGKSHISIILIGGALTLGAYLLSLNLNSESDK